MLPAPTVKSFESSFSLSARIFPALTLLVCTLITAFAIIQMRVTEEDEAFANFSQSSRRLARDVELRLAALTQLAGSGAGLLSAGQSLSRAGWASYIAGLQTIGHGSGFQGLGVAFWVAADAGQHFVARVRKEGEPDFHIWNREGTRPHADMLLPVTYLVPVSEANQRTIGFDLASDAVGAEAIMLARDRGEPSFSGRVQFGPGGDTTNRGLFLFAPFYRGGRPESILERREAFAGVVLVALNAERLLQPLVEQEGTRGIALRVTDLEQERVIFDTDPGLRYARSRFAVDYKLTLGARNWQLEFAGTPQLLEGVNHRNSLLVGIAGVIGSLLLTGIVYHLAALRQRAELRAREMTAELRASEAEVVRHRDHLAERVAERTTELLAAMTAAERANRAKSEFLANMSHELRTPLHAILSFARLGRDKSVAQADEKTQRYFVRIVDAGERLLGLVSDLLDLSRIEAGRMQVEPGPADLGQLLREVVTGLETRATERKLQWQLPPADFRAAAMVDADRFRQVLRNVLSNAVKFSPDGGVIRVMIEQAELPAPVRTGYAAPPVAAWRIAVADEGGGIPEGELEAVFDSFVQSSKTRTGAGGTGLGLAICRQIVAAHRGTISARNRPEGGAVFEILIPR